MWWWWSRYKSFVVVVVVTDVWSIKEEKSLSQSTQNVYNNKLLFLGILMIIKQPNKPENKGAKQNKTIRIRISQNILAAWFVVMCMFWLSSLCFLFVVVDYPILLCNDAKQNKKIVDYTYNIHMKMISYWYGCHHHQQQHNYRNNNYDPCQTFNNNN